MRWYEIIFIAWMFFAFGMEIKRANEIEDKVKSMGNQLRDITNKVDRMR